MNSIGLLGKGYTLWSRLYFITWIILCPSSGPSWCCYRSNMTLNTQREKEPLRRRGSTPIPPAHFYQHPSWTRDPQLPGSTETPNPDRPRPQRTHPPLGQSASYHPGDRSLHYRAHWSSDSDDDSQSDSDCVYRVVLLGDHGVGKTSLAGIFAGITEKDEQPGGGAKCMDVWLLILILNINNTKKYIFDTFSGWCFYLNISTFCECSS